MTGEVAGYGTAVVTENGTIVANTDGFPLDNRIGSGSSAPVLSASSTVIIGGIAVGFVGSSGPYNQMVLAGGDDFTGFSAFTNTTPTGRYATTRSYGTPTRDTAGTGSLLGKSYDVDAYHTGDNDSNLGVVPPWATTLAAANSILTMTAVTDASNAPYQGLNQSGISTAVITGAPWVHIFPPFIIEAYVEYPSGGFTANAGWHPDLPWYGCVSPNLFQAQQTSQVQCNFENSSNHTVWSVEETGTSLSNASNTTTTNGMTGHSYHLYTLTANLPNNNPTELQWYMGTTTSGSDLAIAGTSQVFTYSTLNTPVFPIFTCQTYNAAWQGDTGANLNQTTYASPGAQAKIDFWRFWIPSGQPTITPLVGLGTYTTNFNTAFSFTLPTAAALWGSQNYTTELIQQIILEDFEPGLPTHGSTPSATGFPTGVSWNSSTRVLSGTISSRPGAMNIIGSVWNTSGSLCYVARGVVNVGPHVYPQLVFGIVGQAFTFAAYATADCGTLLPKTLSFGGSWPAGTSYTAPLTAAGSQNVIGTNGCVVGTPTTSGQSTVSVSVTNSVGQNENIESHTMSIGPASPGGLASQIGFIGITSGTLKALFDSTNSGGTVGSQLATWNDTSGNGFNLSLGSGSTGLTLTANVFAQNGFSATPGTIGTGNIPGVSFNGTTDWYSGPAGLANLCCGLTGPNTLVVVALPTAVTATTGRMVSSQVSASVTTSDGETIFCKSLLQGSLIGNNVTSVQSTASTSPSLTQPSMFIATFSGADTSFATTCQINGVNESTSGAISETALANLFSVGAYQSGVTGTVIANFFQGYIACVMVFSGALNATDKTNLRTYLQAYYGTQ